MKNYENLNILNGKKSVCIIGHSKADADALSSMVVFKSFLMDHFKIEHIDMFSDTNIISEKYQEILGEENINPEPESNYDVAIMLDSAKTDRLGCYETLFYSAELKINIDHHNTNELPADINIVEQISSTCELIYKICKSYKYTLSKENKGKIYAGIITDTNNLTVGNFTNETYSIISEFIQDIDHEAIYNHFFGNNTLLNMKILAHTINNIKAFSDGEIIITHLTKSDLEKHGATESDLIGIINRIATINTAKLVCFIYPQDNGTYYVSMRARKGYSVSEIAKKYGGGGHIGAAAFNSTDEISTIENLILSEFTQQIAQKTNIPTNIF